MIDSGGNGIFDVHENELSDPQIELSVLGCILVSGPNGKSGKVFEDISRILGKDDFCNQRHRQIFVAMERLHSDGRPPGDIALLAAELPESMARELVQAMETVPHAEHAEFYANKAKGLSNRRAIISDAKAAIFNAANPSSEDVVSSHGWPSLPELSPLPDAPPFPIETLPINIRPWVDETATALQVPVDAVALMTMAACSFCISKKVWVSIIDGWRVPTNLYVTVVMASGERKSPLYKRVMEPLEAIESEERTRMRPLIMERESIRAALEKGRKSIEKSGIATEEDRQQLREKIKGLNENPQLFMPKFFVDDCTEPTLIKNIGEQGGKLFAASPEGGGPFDLMRGKYGARNMTDINAFLKFHDGENPRTERISREGTDVEEPLLSAAFMVQPTVLESLKTEGELRGRGLLARFLWSYPKSLVGYREIRPKPTSREAQNEYHVIVNSLWECERVELHFSDEADKLLERFQTRLEFEMRVGNPLEALADFASKLAGQAARIAALFHVIEKRSGLAIEPDIAGRAIDLCYWLIPHTIRALRAASANGTLLEKVLSWILDPKNQKPNGEFSARQFKRQRGYLFDSNDAEVQGYLDGLERDGYIRLKPREPGRSGRPSMVYMIHPEII